MALRKVFDPILINQIEIPNRVVRSGHATMFSRQYINDDLINYHVARAKGGIGMSAVEATGVHRSSHFTLRGDHDDAIQGYKRLMAAIRPFGMRVFQQLWHGGHHFGGTNGELPWGVSTVPSPFSGAVPLPVGRSEIEELTIAYAMAARRSREGGIDGVEIHAAHGYLIHQFLSRLTNTRDDEYGGSLENRMRFLLEVLRAVRKEVGKDYVIGVRLGASTVPGGVTEEELIQVARYIQAEGLIDYLNTSWGDPYEPNRSSGAMDEPAGYELASTARITGAVTIPRIVAGRYRTLEEVDQALLDGVADMVVMVRATIADPNLVKKTREGRIESIRPCIACNQGCLGGLLRVGRMGCVVNPAVGFEATRSEDLIVKTPSPRRVIVVGGGPAGLEAARIAAVAGHNVVLFEARSSLGGAVAIAKRAPHIHALADITTWQEQQVYQSGVEVRLGTYATAEDILCEAPDAVIVATGSTPRLDGRQIGEPGQVPLGIEQKHVVSSIDLLTSRYDRFGPHALVLDDTGHYEAIAVAEYLAERDVAVTYVTRLASPAPSLHGLGRVDPALKRLYRTPFRLLTRHHLCAIGVNNCEVRALLSSRQETVPANLVVLVTPNEPLRDTYNELRGQVDRMVLVGDAKSPRDIQAAIHEGHAAARSLP